MTEESDGADERFIVSGVVGYLKAKSTLHIVRTYLGRR